MTTPTTTDTRPWKASAHPWKMRYHQVRAYIVCTLAGRLGTARTFLRLAWKGLRGKVAVMDTRLSEANGGYKYINLVITKLPVSAEHTYEDL